MKRLLRRIRFYNHLCRAFWQKRKKVIILGFVIGIVTFFFIYKVFNFPRENVQRIGLVGKFTVQELPDEIQGLVSAGLTEINEDGSVSPGLAASWEIKNDGKEYWFKIKDNLFWQDEKPVTASDINLKFTDVAVTVVDKKTIKFLLKEPFSPFPVILTKPIFKKGLVGTGEYRFKSIKKNGQIVEKIVLTPVKNKSKSKMIFRFYPTEEAARVGFKLGEVDTLKEIVRPEELLKWKNVQISPQIKFNRFVAIFFNTNIPQLGDKANRQALAYAIKKRWEPRALNSISPSSWAYNNDVKPYNYDLENARKLLENKTNGESKEPLKEIELSTFSSLLPVAEEIKKDWENLGIATKIKVVNVPSDDFQVLLATQEVPPDPDQYLFWHSTQETNIAHYKSPKIDKLLEDGRKELDQEKRKTSYHDFQKFLVEETPAAFLFHPTVYTISKR